jgi:tripartite-type tricarboxylate transporter receptor subunit TctC
MKWRRSLAVAMGLVWFAASAAAQTWPSRPIRLIVPFPPGGATDTAARLIQPPLQQALGVPVVVARGRAVRSARRQPQSRHLTATRC